MTDAHYTWPGADDINLVRWYLGDTATDAGGDIADPLVTDSEIIFALQQKTNPKAAAAFCARYASVKLLHSAELQSVRLLDFSATSGTSSKQWADYYLQLADRLERESSRAGIYSGGMSVAEKEADRLDTDLVQHSFRRGLHDIEGGY